MTYVLIAAAIIIFILVIAVAFLLQRHHDLSQDLQHVRDKLCSLECRSVSSYHINQADKEINEKLQVIADLMNVEFVENPGVARHWTTKIKGVK